MTIVHAIFQHFNSQQQIPLSNLERMLLFLIKSMKINTSSLATTTISQRTEYGTPSTGKNHNHIMSQGIFQ